MGWIEQQTGGNENKPWIACKMSSDGTKMIALSDYVYIFDGANWNKQTSLGVMKSCGISSDGTTFIACFNPGRVYISNNGSSWSEIQPMGDVNGNWSCCDINADGTKYIVGNSTTYGNLYTWNGSSWTTQQPGGVISQSPSCCGINTDGTKFIVGYSGISPGGRLYTFNGSSWSEQQPAGNNSRYWVCCGISADGTKYLAANNIPPFTTSPMYYYNTSWSIISSNNELYNSCALNSDGTKAIFCYYNGYLYTWNGIALTNQMPAGSGAKNWNCCGISSDGNKFIAGVNDGRLYTYTPDNIYVPQITMG